MKEVSLFSLGSNVNIGLYAKRIGDVLVCGLEPSETEREMIERVLRLKIVRTSIAGTPYAGVFLIEAQNRVIAPHILYSSERESLVRAGLTVEVWNTFETALSNVMAVDGNRAILTRGHDELAQCATESGFDVLEVESSEYDSAGSIIVAGDKSVLVGGIDPEPVARFFEKPAIQATINRGSAFLSSGLLFSDVGILIGKDSLPSEVMSITEVLG